MYERAFFLLLRRSSDIQFSSLTHLSNILTEGLAVKDNLLSYPVPDCQHEIGSLAYASEFFTGDCEVHSPVPTLGAFPQHL